VDAAPLDATMNRLITGGADGDRYRIWSILNLAAWAGTHVRPSTTGRTEP